MLLGNGDGTFQTAQAYSSAGFEADSVAVTDVNGDGRADLVVSSLCQGASNCDNGFVQTLIGRGNGTFYPAHGYSSGEQNSIPWSPVISMETATWISSSPTKTARLFS